MKFRTGVLLLLGLLLAGFALVFVPAYLIQPFQHQTKQEVTIAYYFRKFSPFLTVLFSVLAVLAYLRVFRSAKRLTGKIFPAIPVLLLMLFTVFSFQNYFQWMFHPLNDPNFERPQNATFLLDRDMVLACSVSSDSVAYPVRLLAYHHLVNDRVGGKPVVATY
jgi:hypothetical protein